jgi:uncharacterized protein (TIGR03437 family)
MVAGDIAFIRAGVYRETVTPKNSGTQNAPIAFMPYNGESVTVSGADVIPASSWTLSSGNIYKAPMSWDLGNGANQVFLDSQMMIEAQWPNTTLDVSHPTVATTSGGSFVPGGTSLSTGTITVPNLPSRPAGYWNGAFINIRLGAGWVWQTGTVVGSPTGNTQLSFTFSEWSGVNDAIVPSAGNPFYLWGVLGELDAPGEWFAQSSSSTLYFWPPASDSPAQHLVEAKRRQVAFNLSARSFITVQGINLFAATISSDPSSSYLLLDGLTVQYSSHHSLNTGPYPCCADSGSGIAFQGTNNVLSNSTLAWSAGDGIVMGGNGHRVFNNTIRDTAYFPSGGTAIKAGFTTSENVVIGWNNVYNTSRSGINLDPYGGNFFTGKVVHNDVHDFGLQTADLGCIYTYTSDGGGTEIAYNRCHDNHAPGSPYFPGSGIYLDNDTSNYVVHHNVVWNADYALQLTSGGPHQIYNNTFVGNIRGFNTGSQVSGTMIRNNIFTPAVSYFSLATQTNNILPPTDPQFVDPTNHNYQLKPTSPAIAAGLAIPPYTNGYSGSAPDIGAYDHTKAPWKAGVQNAAYVSAPSYAPTLTPGTVAVVSGSVPFDSGVSVLLTDGANVDLPAPLLWSVASPAQLAFQVPAAAAPGVAMITITNGDGAVSLSSAPLFAGPPPISIVASQGSGQSAVISTSFPSTLQATVKDAKGNVAPGVSVTFAVPASGASGNFAGSATVATDNSGFATAPAFTANAVAGSYAVTASAPGVGALAVFNLTNSAGSPATVAATQGSGQIAAINTAFATVLKATVADAGGNGVPGATVTFAAPGSGASGTFAGSAAVQTDASGVATAPVFTANGITGNYSVTASVAGVSAPASFTLTNAVAGPTIAAGGITGAGGSVPPVHTLSQGALISIYGTGFLPAGTTGRRVSPSEYVNGALPTALLGVCVDVSGQRAAMLDVYPTQINAQVPAVTGASAAVRVLTNCGTPTETASAPQTAAVSAASPEFLYFQLNANGTNPVALVNAVTGALVGPSNILNGVLTPARAGDILTAYGTGFGALTPAVATGRIPQGTASTVGPVSVTIGGVALAAWDILYSGAAPGQIIDQLNFRVPANVAAGNQPIVISIAGINSPPNAFVAIQQ